MSLRFHFTVEPDWRTAPVAFWVHVPLDEANQEFLPSAPVAVQHKGYAFLHVEVGEVDLQFSSLAQLHHFIEVMDSTPLPTSTQLSRRWGALVGPNGQLVGSKPHTFSFPPALAVEPW